MLQTCILILQTVLFFFNTEIQAVQGSQVHYTGRQIPGPRMNPEYSVFSGHFSVLSTVISCFIFELFFLVVYRCVV